MKPLYEIMTFGQVPQLFCLLLWSLERESCFLSLGTVWWFRVGWKCNIKVVRADNPSCFLLQPSTYATFLQGSGPLLEKLQCHGWGERAAKSYSSVLSLPVLQASQLYYAVGVCCAVPGMCAG